MSKIKTISTILIMLVLLIVIENLHIFELLDYFE